MNFFKTTKVFAYFLLFFLIFTVAVNAQTIEAGTKIVVRMDNEINSKVSSANDTFTATLAEPLMIGKAIVLPVGTIVEGKITNVRRASTGGKNGKISVSFETLRLPDGTKRAIEAILVNDLQAGNSTAKYKTLAVIGGAAAGGIIGAVIKSSSGALLGAGVGAGAGTAFALMQKGRDVRLKADETFEIKLTRSVSLPVQDY